MIPFRKSANAAIPEHWKDHDRSIRPYRLRHLVVTWTGRITSMSLIYFLATDQHIQRIHTLTSNVFEPNSLLQILLFMAVIAGLFQATLVPFQWLHYRIERQFKLSKQSWGGWLLDLLKGFAVGVVLGGVALTALVVCYQQLGTLWWLAVAILFILFSVLLAQLAPILLIPIFYKLEPLVESPLKERLFELCRRFQITVKDIYHLGLGEKTEKGNAAFVGLGKTKRIILGDTLYKNFSPEEVEAVFAHELGHQVHDDLWKGIFLSSGLLTLSFGVTDAILRKLVLNSPSLEESTGIRLVLFFVVYALISIPLDWVQTVFTRWRERMADQFAADTARLSIPLASALERLTIQNKGQFCPNRLVEFLTFSHPAPWRRITRLRSAGGP